MANRNEMGTAVAPGRMARVAAGLRYAFTGREPDWFGPLQAQRPQAPADVAGRRFDFPAGYNLRSQPRQDEGVSFAQLRSLAESHDLLRIVIETRKDQMAKMRWMIRPREKGRKPDPRCSAAQDFFAMPDRENAWDEWLRMLLEDLLVIDAPAIYPRRTRGGQLYALEPVDGATIMRVLDGHGRTPAAPDPAYQQILKGLPAVNYTRDELIYSPRNLRTHRVYGYGPVEQIVMSVNIALRRQLHQLEYYRSGSLPDALAGVPESWQPAQIGQFQEYWDLLLAGESAGRRGVRFVPGEIAKNFRETKQPPLKDLYDEWLARVICFAFSVEPTPFIAQVNRATAESAREQALAEGLAPLQNWIKGLVDFTLAQHMQAPDLEFAWEEDEAVDPLVQAQVSTLYVNAGVMTVNEVRATLGLPALSGQEQERAAPKDGGADGGESDEAGDEPGNGAGGEKAACLASALRKGRAREGPKAPRPPGPRELARARRQLAGDIEGYLAGVAGEMATQVAAQVAGLAKARRRPLGEEEEDAEDALEAARIAGRIADRLDFSGWRRLVGQTAGALATAAWLAADSVTVVGLSVAGDGPAPEIDTHALGMAVARDRAAEMVGMKWVAGRLVPNPNAAWQITEGTRDMLRPLIEQAVAQGWSAETTTGHLRDSHAFSPARARMIARTEFNMARMRGSFDGAGAMGATHKAWSTSQDDRVSPECQLCEAQGDIGIDEAFVTGVVCEPNHPNCRCSLIFSLRDAWDGGQPTAKAYSPDQPRDETGRWTDGVSSFVNRALSSPKEKQPPHLMEAVPADAVENASLLGVSLHGKRVALDHDTTRHLLLKHGGSNEGLRGQVAVDAGDLALLPKILSKGSMSIGNPARGSDGTRRLQVIHQERGHSYVAVFSVRKRTVVPVTIYKKKNRTA